jgi:hypothetical protein
MSRTSVADPEQRIAEAGAGAEIFGPPPAPGMQKCYKIPIIFHTKNLKLSLY